VVFGVGVLIKCDDFPVVTSRHFFFPMSFYFPFSLPNAEVPFLVTSNSNQVKSLDVFFA